MQICLEVCKFEDVKQESRPSLQAALSWLGYQGLTEEIKRYLPLVGEMHRSVQQAKVDVKRVAVKRQSVVE